MKTPKHILLAIDLYDNYSLLLQRAIQIAKGYNTALHVVHVIPHILSTIPYAYDFQADLETEAKNELNKLKLAATNIHLETHLLDGTPKNEIVKLADKLNIDLLIIGSHGKHGIDLLLGSTANGVLHLAKCNVLTIRLDADGKPSSHGQYQRILLASDLHNDSQAVTATAKALAQQYAAELFVINVVPDTTIVSGMYTPQLEIDLKAEIEPRMNKLCTELGIPEKHRAIITGHPKAEILEYAKTMQTDLIVIGSHGRKGLASALLGATANAVLHNATLDVFVTRIHQ